jgi:hypothetical protein
MFGSGDAHSRLVAAIQKVSLWDRNPYFAVENWESLANSRQSNSCLSE